MTALTFYLPDSLVSQAKRQGVFSEQALNEVLFRYLSAQVEQTQTENQWLQFFAERNHVDVPDNFLRSHQLDVQQRDIFG